MMRRLLLTAIPLVVLFLAACGQGPRQGSVTLESPPADASTEPARESDILKFKAPKLGGGQVDGGDLEGKDVALWFWAPW